MKRRFAEAMYSDGSSRVIEVRASLSTQKWISDIAEINQRIAKMERQWGSVTPYMKEVGLALEPRMIKVRQFLPCSE